MRSPQQLSFSRRRPYIPTALLPHFCPILCPFAENLPPRHVFARFRVHLPKIQKESLTWHHQTKRTTMKNFFNELPENCHHLWTPENFEIIFTSTEDFKAGMSIFGVTAKLFPSITILTFVLMSNHLHITLCGDENEIFRFFDKLKSILARHFKSKGRTINWSIFSAHTRKLRDLNEIRNVIVYNNRNGYVVNPSHTPFSYPWGAGKYFFNPDAKAIAKIRSKTMTTREKRNAIHSHLTKGINDLTTYNGYACPLSFCEIETAEQLFITPGQYFHKLSKNVENLKEIANEIGESIFYTDDELYSIVSSLTAKEYNQPRPSLISPIQKIDVARKLRFEYHASDKQISRILRIPAKSAPLEESGFPQ